ncbi:MAG TPA: deoxyribose-phosphate aldolase [Melioribacteraceae bacterium]|nr:deoxyribose-phosphate aldolase [Melioribacteraceae bacterium]
MDSRIDKIVNQVFIEKSLHDFYCSLDSCKGWEKNVVEQPKAVKKIIESGAERIAAGIGIGSEISDIGLARMIDHTLLKPEATSNDIIKLCEEAKRYSFASVCVNPFYVSLCYSILKNTPVKVCTVIGFPLGANTTETKRFEAEQAINNGAEEIDMVINIGKLKEGDYKTVFEDVNKVVLTAKKHNAVCKVILETALLTDEEKIKACLICKEAKADFVKTSTGFSKGGATAADIALMKYVVGSSVGVKASGGVRSYEDAALLIESGADRVGASASVKIVNKEINKDKGY